MILPALVEAGEDMALHGAALRVYVWLLPRLDFHTARLVKVDGAAGALQLNRRTVRRALRLLVARGYVDRRHLGTQGHSYRLLWTRIAPEGTPVSHSRASQP